MVTKQLSLITQSIIETSTVNMLLFLFFTAGSAKNLQRSSVQELKDTYLDNKIFLSNIGTAYLVNNKDTLYMSYITLCTELAHFRFSLIIHVRWSDTHIRAKEYSNKTIKHESLSLSNQYGTTDHFVTGGYLMHQISVVLFGFLRISSCHCGSKRRLVVVPEHQHLSFFHRRKKCMLII